MDSFVIKTIGEFAPFRSTLQSITIIVAWSARRVVLNRASFWQAFNFCSTLLWKQLRPKRSYFQGSSESRSLDSSSSSTTLPFRRSTKFHSRTAEACSISTDSSFSTRW
jgi:hypothetical protein